MSYFDSLQEDDSALHEVIGLNGKMDSKNNLYKTELCHSFEETGNCKYGNKCQFAHGKEELRVVSKHPRYKSEICKTFHTTGTCPYGKRCRFIHMDNLPNIWSPSSPLNYLILHEECGNAIDSLKRFFFFFFIKKKKKKNN